MNSVEPGTYKAQGQPDIIVTYGGELSDDAEHYGPWVFWRFPWDVEGTQRENLCFQFRDMLAAAKYELAVPHSGKGG